MRRCKIVPQHVACVALLSAACNTITDRHHGASVGLPCSSVGQQSSCDVTETCTAITSANMCTLQCYSDSDCGSNGSDENRCVQFQGMPYCFRGCAPDSADAGTDAGSAAADGGATDAGVGPCGRSDFVCITPNSGGEYYCSPDCRQQAAGFCDYGAVCVASTGACAAQTCSATSECPSGTICATVNGQMTCVPNCATTTCPSGTTCNSTGGCDTITVGLYGVCGGSTPCGPSLDCVGIDSNSTPVCMQTCTQTSDCSGQGSSASCALPLGDGKTVCALQCAPGLSTCPVNTECQAASVSTSTDFCLPPG